jgi:DNA polymerase-4
LKTEGEVEALMLLLAESVASRMVDYGFKKARSISLLIMFNNLDSKVRMCKMNPPTRSSTEFARYGMKLFKENFDWSQMLVRGLGLSVSDFVDSEQLSIEGNSKVEKEENLESAVEHLRRRFGRNILQRGIVLEDSHMSELNIKDDHIIHPGS